MGKLVNGTWHDVWYETKKSGGRFVRPDAGFRNWITGDGSPGPTGEGGFAPQKGRYHLYVSLACPWAHRTLIFRKLKGLEEFVSVSVVNFLMGASGWTFEDGVGVIPDPLFDSDFLHQVYVKSDPDYTGRVTVPVLWDKEGGRIINNESSEIIRMFNSAFDSVGAAAGDSYPPRTPCRDRQGQRSRLSDSQQRRLSVRLCDDAKRIQRGTRGTLRHDGLARTGALEPTLSGGIADHRSRLAFVYGHSCVSMPSMSVTSRPTRSAWLITQIYGHTHASSINDPGIAATVGHASHQTPLLPQSRIDQSDPNCSNRTRHRFRRTARSRHHMMPEPVHIPRSEWQSHLNISAASASAWLPRKLSASQSRASQENHFGRLHCGLRSFSNLRWISAMRSHESYEEGKLYPFLEMRWGVSMNPAAEWT